MMSFAVDSQPANTNCKRVLVVEDDRDLAAIYQHLLESCHYEVRTAGNGALALKVILYQDVDAILCDLRMPELEGDLFYQAVEHTKPHLCHRFIFVTGVADDSKYHAFLSRIKAPVLHKPVQPARLLETLQHLLQS